MKLVTHQSIESAKNAFEILAIIIAGLWSAFLFAAIDNPLHARPQGEMTIKWRSVGKESPYVANIHLEITNAGKVPFTVSEVHIDAWLVTPEAIFADSNQPGIHIASRTFLENTKPSFSRTLVDGLAFLGGVYSPGSTNSDTVTVQAVSDTAHILFARFDIVVNKGSANEQRFSGDDWSYVGEKQD